MPITRHSYIDGLGSIQKVTTMVSSEYRDIMAYVDCPQTVRAIPLYCMF